MKILLKTFLRLLVLTFWLSPLPCTGAPDMMLPQVDKGEQDVRGWLMSEKLDGIRGYWDGKKLLSKGGKPLYPPPEFLKDFPPFALEGELWGGRGTFEQASSIVMRQQPHSGWLKLKFGIFDVPEAPGGFQQRINKATEWFVGHPSPYCFVIPQRVVLDRAHLHTELSRIEALGGEGLIVRSPEGLYKTGRTATVLKIKQYEDAEATVLAHLPGEGRNKGRLGSLLVELPNGNRFKIGTGFSDSLRENPPPVGTTITFKYYGYYQSGIPKFPSFLRVRFDKELL